MASKIITLSLSAEMLKRTDEAAKASFASRSDYIRQAIVQRLSKQPNYSNNQAQETSKERREMTDEEWLEQLSKQFPAKKL